MTLGQLSKKEFQVPISEQMEYTLVQSDFGRLILVIWIMGYYYEIGPLRTGLQETEFCRSKLFNT